MKTLKLTSKNYSPSKLGDYIEKARYTWAALHYNSPEYELVNFFSSVSVMSKDAGSEAIMNIKDNKLIDIYVFLYFLSILSKEELNIRIKADGLEDIDVTAFFQEEDYETVMSHFSAYKKAIEEWEDGENAIQAFTKALG